MADTERKRPGPKPLAPEDRQRVITLRLRPDLEAKYIALGGVKWLREAIKRARLPASTDT